MGRKMQEANQSPEKTHILSPTLVNSVLLVVVSDFIGGFWPFSGAICGFSVSRWLEGVERSDPKQGELRRESARLHH
jgi:hypothetical protein